MLVRTVDARADLKSPRIADAWSENPSAMRPSPSAMSTAALAVGMSAKNTNVPAGTWNGRITAVLIKRANVITRAVQPGILSAAHEAEAAEPEITGTITVTGKSANTRTIVVQAGLRTVLLTKLPVVELSGIVQGPGQEGDTPPSVNLRLAMVG